jgi:hypothetical protein
MTVIEPCESDSANVSVTDEDEKQVRIALKGGRTQVLRVSGLEEGMPSVQLREFQDGVLAR